ncbi:hypothetical protein FISHEDRAFT_69531 [Fistulina hepatica ATCC 64428]|uniref:DASH complex subunit ASK1 n=1 Tax=Fistulina hepatica ATCC 64428 TaxID=1128425 RepID=A0A0D7AN41_9AGAR|nr:hypothetical protein FISHEDRAFT_69531 [Fistulina hepatica ATCC 64428]
MSDRRRPIAPNPPRWKPNPDPVAILVTGLDTSAPVLDQIEQIDQLITLKLQNIDENFAKIHNILANRILPSVKRYSVGVQPVRDTAQFWTEFYEQAAQIHIPTYDDYSTVNEPSEPASAATHEEVEGEENKAPSTVATSSGSGHFNEPSVTSVDASFTPSKAAFSSTPATERRIHPGTSFSSEASEDPSWPSSIESPMVRLDRDLKAFSREEIAQQTLRVAPSLEFDEATPTIKVDKGKSKAQPEPLLRSVLRHTLYSTSDISADLPASPLRPKGRPRTSAGKTNPYLPANGESPKWNGLVDLKSKSLPRTTPVRPRFDRAALLAATSETTGDDSDDSLEELPAGMSPPVLVSPARRVRLPAVIELTRTPTKSAAARIHDDLVSAARRQESVKLRKLYGFPLGSAAEADSSRSTMSTAPSLSRYRESETDTSAAEQSLESVMRRLDMDLGEEPTYARMPRLPTTPALRLRSKQRKPEAAPPTPPPPEPEPEPEPEAEPELDLHERDVKSKSPEYAGDETTFPQQDDFSDDSMDEINDTAHPSAAFLLAAQVAGRGSDDSDSDDSFDDDEGALPAVQFVAAGEDSFDDSFDDDVGGEQDEETVFGIGARVNNQITPGGGLQLLGANLVQDTEQFSEEVGRLGIHSPTPSNWPPRGKLQ